QFLGSHGDEADRDDVTRVGDALRVEHPGRHAESLVGLPLAYEVLKRGSRLEPPDEHADNHVISMERRYSIDERSDHPARSTWPGRWPGPNKPSPRPCRGYGDLGPAGLCAQRCLALGTARPGRFCSDPVSGALTGPGDANPPTGPAQDLRPGAGPSSPLRVPGRCGSPRSSAA